MAGKTACRVVTVVNPQGLHARPANKLARLASQFEAEVEIGKDGEQVDGKSILSVLTLAAVQGTQLSIRACGTDADEAVEALVGLFENGFADEELAETVEKQDSDER